MHAAEPDPVYEAWQQRRLSHACDPDRVMALDFTAVRRASALDDGERLRSNDALLVGGNNPH